MILVVGLLGALGAVTRYFVDSSIQKKLFYQIPWVTIFINVSGSFVLGLLIAFLTKNHELAQVPAFLGTGFCGGYTTFSTASYESVRLIQKRQYFPAGVNIVGSMVLALLAFSLGVTI